MSGAVEFPTPGVGLVVDDEAERAVVGCAIATGYGAQLAVDHGVTPDLLHDRRLAGWLAAAIDLGDAFPTDTDRRCQLVADQVGVPVAAVREVVNDRPVMFDRSASFARRVIAASHRRADGQRRLAEFEELGFSVTLDKVAGVTA